MANNTNINPYGTGGQVANGLGIVNDLRTGGANKALSANMGVELNDRLLDFEGVELYVRDAESDFDDMSINNFAGEKAQDSGFSVSRKIRVEGGQKIRVYVTASKSPVIAQSATDGADNYSSTANGSVPYVSGQTYYEYTAPAGGKWVSVVYKTSDGFRLEMPKTSLIERVDDEERRLGGEEIPFDINANYNISNGSLIEQTGGSGKYRTQPITLSEYKALFYTGLDNSYPFYACAIFFDGNGDYIGKGLYNREGAASDAKYTMCDVLQEAPAGAVTVVLQTYKGAVPDSKVIGFKTLPPSFVENKWWRWDSFGIKGDGVTDDSDALQQYIYSSYGDVQLKKGVYRITKPLQINPTFVRKIVGNGATIVLDGDIYGLRIYGYVGDTADPNVSAEKMASTGLVVEDVIITSADGLAWHDNTSGSSVGTGTAISVQKAFMLTLRGCEIYSVENGVKFENKNRNIIIEGCHIYNCWGSGILFASGVNLHQVNIANNHISYCKYCINFDNPSQIANLQITCNDIETSNIYPAGVTEADKRCIRFVCNNNTTACYEIEIVGNTIQGHGNYADYLLEFVGRSDDAVDTLMSIVGNHLSNCARAIGLSYAYDVSISGNNVNNVSTGFVYLAGGTIQRVAVSGNTLNSQGKPIVSTGSTAALSHISVTGNVGNNTPITIDGASQDYISVVGNCLGGGTVTIGDATHKQEANNI